jgi:hypothetical protein
MKAMVASKAVMRMVGLLSEFGPVGLLASEKLARAEGKTTDFAAIA